MITTAEERKKVERALLIGITHPDTSDEHTMVLLEELAELVSNLDIQIGELLPVKIRQPKARMLVGSGKAEQIIQLVKTKGYDCIVFDDELSPAQQRNWEKESGVCVIDRQEVILDIFAERAQTKEAVLQVELARAEYDLPRLTRAWTHLSRQRGGGATQRDAGETQLQLDQRLVRNRISRLKQELDIVVKQRNVQRKRRVRIPLPTAAIVGYTNAGKSTLLNTLTQAKVLAEDMLFATLDPTTRKLELPSGKTLLLTDTVGFVRRLPHRLVEAFKATLEEALLADFLIHVVDASSPSAQEYMETTLDVLKELGAEQKRIITVFNKMDLVEPGSLNALPNPGTKQVCHISLRKQQGLNELLILLDQQLEADHQTMQLLIPTERYDIVNRVHQLGSVKERRYEAEGVYLLAEIPQRAAAEFKPFLQHK